MPDKLTDSEIGKALEICASSTNGCSHNKYTCEDCYLNGQPMCSAVLHQDTIDLINRLQATIKELTEQFNEQGQAYDVLYKESLSLKAENERLNFLLNDAYENNHGLVELLERAKAEAYKEFAERLQKKIDPTLIAVTMIGNILVEVSKSHITADNAIEKIREYLKDLEIETRLSFDMAVCNLLKELIGE